MGSQCRLSVVIPTCGRSDSLQRLLMALARQTLPADQFEVIVSLDGSTDSSREIVAQFPGPFALRSTWRPRAGRAAACNAGIRDSRSELVVLLDDDMEPEPGCLAAHLAAHLDTPRLGVMGAVPIVFDGTSSPVVQFIGQKFQQHLNKLAAPGSTIGFRDFYSGNFSAARSTLLDVGLFDEDFRDYGNEDGELARRLLAAGVPLRYSAAALARQHYEKDFDALAHDNVGKGRTAVLLARKDPGTYGSLLLSKYDDGTRSWRAIRAALLAFSAVFRFTPDLVIKAVHWLERRRSPHLPHYYRLALEYFYWMGARQAGRDLH